MKKKFQYSDILLVIIPIVMLVISMSIDWLEPIMSKYYFWEWKMDLLSWMESLGRVVFVLVIFMGTLYFINNKHKTKLHSTVWLGLGFLAIFVSTPWGHAMHLVPAQMRLIQFYPRNLFFLSGAFLLAIGIYGLIRPVENRQE